MYRKTTDFCVLIFVPGSVTEFMYSNSFLVVWCGKLDSRYPSFHYDQVFHSTQDIVTPMIILWIKSTQDDYDPVGLFCDLLDLMSSVFIHVVTCIIASFIFHCNKKYVTLSMETISCVQLGASKYTHTGVQSSAPSISWVNRTYLLKQTQGYQCRVHVSKYERESVAFSAFIYFTKGAKGN